jgi:hypothetical protein
VESPTIANTLGLTGDSGAWGAVEGGGVWPDANREIAWKRIPAKMAEHSRSVSLPESGRAATDEEQKRFEWGGAKLKITGKNVHWHMNGLQSNNAGPV